MKRDNVYQHDLKDLMELEQRYDELNLSKEHRIFIGDYIACMQTVHARAKDISYMAGFKDAVSFFHSLNLFKETKLYGPKRYCASCLNKRHSQEAADEAEGKTVKRYVDAPPPGMIIK